MRISGASTDVASAGRRRRSLRSLSIVAAGAAVVLVGVVSALAWSRAPSRAAGHPASTDPLTAASVPHTAAGSTAFPTRPQLAFAGTEESVPWTLDAIATEQPRLVISTSFGDCAPFDYVQVDETPTEVTITVHTRDRFQTCAQDLGVARGYVPLNGPLGARTLIHAATTAPG